MLCPFSCSVDACGQRVSQEFYAESTHFLLELVQNADDNTYDAENTPTLRIRYERERGLLLVQCNEVGFSQRNVEAICAIGRSSKDGIASGIGEKGVGFKSVFKVADLVWIQSGHYSFKFDRSQPLGIVTPIPDRFPVPEFASNKYTIMCLRIDKSFDAAEISSAMKRLDPRLLLFLRKLRTLDLSIAELKGERWSAQLRRAELVSAGSDSIYSTVDLFKDGTRQRYALTTHIAHALNPSPRRANRTESELVFGFAVSDNGTPILSPQWVHAFLPVRNYGFKVRQGSNCGSGMW